MGWSSVKGVGERRQLVAWDWWFQGVDLLKKHALGVGTEAKI